MKICLIEPPKIEDYGHLTMSPAPPLGLAYIAGALESKGHDVTVIASIGDAATQYTPFKPFGLFLEGHENLVMRGLNEFEILKRVPKDVNVIGFRCMFTNNWIMDRYIINFLRPYFPDVLFIAGGEHATAAAKYCIEQSGLDAIVLGEGEETVVNIVDAFRNKLPFDSINGIAYRKDSEIVITSNKIRVKNIEDIPQPAWHLFPVKNYFNNDMTWSATSAWSLPLIATRGCPYSCTFCSSPQMWGTRYYMRPPEDVADEIEKYVTNYHINNIELFDLTAIIKKEWIVRFCKILIEKNLNITWQIPAGTRSEAIDDEVAMYLKASGCSNIVYAPESGSVRVLKDIKKKVKIKSMLQSIRSSNQQGLNVMVNMIIGLPSETHRDVWATYWFLIRCAWEGANTIALSTFQPYPGSALFDKFVAEGKIHPDTDEYYLEQVYLDTSAKMPFYNSNIDRKVYWVYWWLTYMIFYSSNFLFRPIRAFKVFKNIIFKSYESRFERQIGRMLRNIISKEQKLNAESN